MEQQFINYNGKRYPVKEPTIEMYANVMKLKDLLTPEELFIKMISETTTLTVEQIKNSPTDEIIAVGNNLFKHFNKESKEVFLSFEFKNKKYNLVDVYKISFGQFVDIDTFLSKDENYKISNLNELASYLFIENGKEYSSSDTKQKTDDFKELPLKFVEGAIFFLVSLGMVSSQLTQIYSKNKFLWMTMRLLMTLTSIGAGIPRFRYYPKTKFGKLMKLLLYPLFLFSTILRTCWMSIRRKKKK